MKGKVQSARINPQRAIQLYGDAKEQLERESNDVGRKVCGFTRSPPLVPSDYYTEQAMKAKEEQDPILKAPTLSRNITLIPPQIANDVGFVVPSLLLHNSGGGQFF